MNRRRFLATLATSGAAIAARPLEVMARRHHADGPADILLIRHAEEPLRGPHLNDRGNQRAQALSKLFDRRFPRPTALFASQSTKQSARAVETLQPLAAALGLTIHDKFAEGDYKALADHLRTDRTYSGGHVLVCWHHGTLPELAHALGVVRAPKWPDTQYDGLWVIKYEDGRAALTPEFQYLLPGDRS
jgi:phosphohistidine phosphatase SixA